MSPLPTLRQTPPNHTITAFCLSCPHYAALDVPPLIAAGWGDRPAVRLPYRCTACGARGAKLVLRPPEPTHAGLMGRGGYT